MIKRKKIDTTIERSILTGMIVSDQFLKEIVPIYSADLMEIEYAPVVAKWCLDYFKQYGKAIGIEIQDVFDTWRRTTKNEEQEEYIEKFLISLSDEFERADKFNAPYMFDKAILHFKKKSLRNLSEEISYSLAEDNVEDAELALQEFRTVERQTNTGIDPFDNQEAIQTAFESKSEPLFKVPGALGRLLNDEMTRDSFISLMGPEKRGKCIAADSLVLLPDGKLKTIADIVKDKDQYNVTFNEKTQKFEKGLIVDHWTNGKKECIKVTTKTGREVTVTPNHPFLTPSGWKNIGEIEVGQRIAVPKRVTFFGTKKANSEAVRVLAYILAEGGVSSNFISFTSTYPEIQEDFTRCIEACGSSTTWENEKTCGVNNPKELKGKHGKNKVRNWIERLGLLCTGSKDKTIPDIVFQLTKEKLAEFINILFTCDGSIHRTSTAVCCIGYSSASQTMIKQLQHLLLRFGIVSLTHYKKAKCNGKEFNHYCLDIRDSENILKFIEEIGFSYHKHERVLEYLPELEKAKQKSFLDSFPYEIVEKIKAIILKETKQSLTQAIGGKLNEYVRASIQNKKPLMRLSVQQIYDKCRLPEVKAILDSEILWDVIVDKEEVGLVETYDLSVNVHHNFIANDCLVHNTWNLMFFAMQAHRGRCNVAFFQVGDMSEAQMVRRQHIYLSKKSDLKKFCGELKIPTLDCELNQKDTCTLRHRTSKFGCYEDGVVMSYEDAAGYVPCTACVKKAPKNFKGAVWHILRPEVEPLTWREAYKAGLEYKKKVRAKGFKLATFANRSISVTGIANVLDRWEQTEGFIADVVVIDYADILAPENTKVEFRHQENEKWMALRALSQKRHVCLITATQTNRESYDAKNIEMKHAGEDKRKFAHATAVYALNQYGDEKQQGVMRFSPLAVREDAFDSNHNVHVLQCLQIGSPYISSY